MRRAAPVATPYSPVYSLHCKLSWKNPWNLQDFFSAASSTGDGTGIGCCRDLQAVPELKSAWDAGLTGQAPGFRLLDRHLNQWVGETLTMLGNSWRPVVAQRGRDAPVCGAVNPVSQRYTPGGSSTAGKEPQGRWRLLLLNVRHAAGSWLRRTRQRRALTRLDERLLRDIGLPPDGPSLEEERRACLVPFRLPRQ